MKGFDLDRYAKKNYKSIIVRFTDPFFAWFLPEQI
jgi:hypothetical protein